MSQPFLLNFCTYFSCIEEFKFTHETYSTAVAFCVKQGAFSYRIGEESEQQAYDGELVICPPGLRFSRKIVSPLELCMIKFTPPNDYLFLEGKIKINDRRRFFDDLDKLKGCLFCASLEKEPLFSHYCTDILYLAADSLRDNTRLSAIKQQITQSLAEPLCFKDIAARVGYTPQHFINMFKKYYGITPKAYLSEMRILKAKELLVTTDLLSREIAFALGFSDELYFIRFFKKHTGFTPKQFRQNRGI